MVSATAATSLSAQVSPRLNRFISRADTSVVVWLVARPGTDLDQLAADATARGATVRRISRFAQAVSVVARGSEVRALSSLRGVRRVQLLGTFHRPPVRRLTRPPLDPSAAAPSAVPSDTLYGPGAWTMDLLRIRSLHDRGLRGLGVRIAMLDAGFNTLHPYMVNANVIAERDFVHNDSVVRDQPGEPQGEMTHGTGTWSLIAANTPGRLFGVAPDAEFLLARTELTVSETRVEEDNWVAAIEWAVGLGAHIVSSSLGYLSFDGGFSYTRAQLNGDFAITTIAADSAARLGVLVVVSAGNQGPQGSSLSTPADADSVVAVGAVDSLSRIASFSSRGPSGDGRLKPEVLAPGVNIPVAARDTGLSIQDGTSFAAPLIAGLAALVQGAHPPAPAIRLRDGLIMSGRRFLTADNTFGNGLADGLLLYAFPTGVRFVSPAAGTLTTLTPTFQWQVAAPPPGAGANVYFLRIATDSLMQTMVLDTFLTQTSFQLPAPLPPGRRLWFRLVASSTVGAVESTAVHGPLVTPDWATQLTLADPQGASIRDSLPLLAWSSPGVTSPPGPFTYDVDVYPASRTPAQAVASARGLTDTMFMPPSPLERNLPFRWRVVAHLGADSQIITSPGTFLVLDETVPRATLLFQNFPNPFPSIVTGQSTTCIWFDVANDGQVRLEVFDIRGRLVRTIVPSAAVPTFLPAGRYGRPASNATGTCDPRFSWDGRDNRGDFVRPGVYLYRLTAPGLQTSRRVVWLGVQ